MKIPKTVMVVTMLSYSGVSLSAPSKDETIKYLNNKINENAIHFDSGAPEVKECSIYHPINNGSWKGYSVSIKEVVVEREQIDYTFPNKADYLVKLRCTGKPSRCIDLIGDKEKIDGATIVNTKSADLADKLYKALSHLRTLCLGRKELF